MIRRITMEQTDEDGVSYFTIKFFVKFGTAPLELHLNSAMSAKQTVIELLALAGKILDLQ